MTNQLLAELTLEGGVLSISFDGRSAVVTGPLDLLHSVLDRLGVELETAVVGDSAIVRLDQVHSYHFLSSIPSLVRKTT